MRHWHAVTLASLLTLSGGCATVTHQSTTSGNSDDKGIRYLGTSPYLIAYSNGKGGVVTEVHYLPDPNKLMSASPSAKLADVGSTMNFDRGVLTDSTDTGDATAVPGAILKAVEAFGPKLLGILNETQKDQEHSIPAPYIFKIVVNGTRVVFRGSQGDTEINLTLLPPADKED
jgi:hypothetical protein